MRRTFLFVALAVAIALVGCAQILGIGDVDLRDGGNTSDTGNAADTGISEGSAIDDANVGPCVTCTLDNDGSPCALACNQPTPSGIRLGTGGLVYWTTEGEAPTGTLAGGGVWKAPLNLSAGPTLIEKPSDGQPKGISISDEQAIAYSLRTENAIRITDGGIDASYMFTSTAPDPQNVEITNDGTVVFFICGLAPNGKLYRHAQGDGGTSLFTTDTVSGLDLSITAAGWTTTSGNVVVSPFDLDAATSTITNGQSHPGVVALRSDGSVIAWSTSPDPTAASVVTAITATHVLSNPIWSGQSVGGLRFAPGTDVLYITDPQAGSVFRVDAASASNPVAVASGQNHPSAIDVGNVWVVWTNRGDGNSNGSVMRMAAH